MMNRTNFPDFLKKTRPTAPAKPGSRMKSRDRNNLGGDMSEADTKSRRSFIGKPLKKRFIK
jgi:hypothetical protein